MIAPRRILIVGGYGTFGGRVARLLANEERIVLLIAGRSMARAEAFCARYAGTQQMLPCLFDRTGDIPGQIALLRPDLVIDAAGPFQIYGDAPYALPRAAIHAGANYLDLADGSDFVAGIGRLDAEAKARGVFAYSGVSTFPALSSSVVKSLLAEGDRPETVEAGLSPSPRADLGLSVIRAVASYAGLPIAITRNGGLAVAYALSESRKAHIAAPGRIPLGQRRFSLVDVPDLTLLKHVWPDLRNVWIGAAMNPSWLQRCLNFCAWLVRLRVALPLERFAPLMLRMRNFFARGEHRGGMYVRVSGRDRQDQTFLRTWHMQAEGDDGPFIPAIPAAAIVLRWLDGRAPEPGARPALQILELEDFAPFFRTLAVTHGIRSETPNAPLYRRALGDAFERLPPALRQMHDRPHSRTVSGRADIERGKNPLARFAGAIFGFPPEGRDVPVRVTFDVRGDVEIWQRDFAGRRFQSVQTMGRGRNAGLIDERFGPITVGLAYDLDGSGRGYLRVRNWRVLGLPMPRWLAPGGETYESERDGRFCFHVEIAHPLTGPIVSYRGWLADGTEA